MTFGDVVDDDRNGRRRRLVCGLSALAFVIVIVAATAAMSGVRLNIKTASVPIPSAQAAPDQVVRAYIDAYDQRDFVTMATLYPNGYQPDWWDRHQRMGRMSVLQVTPGVSDADYGGSSADVDVFVDCTYVGSSPQIPYPGPGYILERQGPDHAWRIVDQGQG